MVGTLYIFICYFVCSCCVRRDRVMSFSVRIVDLDESAAIVVTFCSYSLVRVLDRRDVIVLPFLFSF
jgi:hypothetical protein